MNYHRPYVSEIEDTSAICDYGCGNTAVFIFANGKHCCSKHFNSCPGKRAAFSKLDHTSRTAKSLITRTERGITKTSQIKAGETRRKQGHYQRLADKMKEHWAESPWNNNIQCPLLPYRDTTLVYQGSYEYDFLEKLELEHGLDWVKAYVVRGPSIWYIDPTDCTKRLYISDFLVHNTIYEIKSSWTWNKNGTDVVLEEKNRAKLRAARDNGYQVVLVLDREINEKIVD